MKNAKKSMIVYFILVHINIKKAVKADFEITQCYWHNAEKVKHFFKSYLNFIVNRSKVIADCRTSFRA